MVGYSTMTEFVPAKSRGRRLGLMAVFVVTGLPAASLLGYLVIPSLGWRAIITASLVAAILGAVYPQVSDPVPLPAVGFALTVPIYVLVALLFGIHTPELFRPPSACGPRAFAMPSGAGRPSSRPSSSSTCSRRTAWAGCWP